MNYIEYLGRGRDIFLENLSIDLVIIGYQNKRLKCLMLQFGEKWLLPGGFIKKEESVDTAVYRILEERTALKEPHLQFLSVFGHKDREFSEEFEQFFKSRNLEWDDTYWFNNRFVTLSYYSLVDIEKTHPAIHEVFDSYKWFDFEDLPSIWMDHETILKKARAQLKSDIKQEQIVHHLLPREFTMPALHELHESILEQRIDRSRFQKKMLASKLFERLPKLEKKAPGRNPFQYRLK